MQLACLSIYFFCINMFYCCYLSVIVLQHFLIIYPFMHYTCIVYHGWCYYCHCVCFSFFVFFNYSITCFLSVFQWHSIVLFIIAFSVHLVFSFSFSFLLLVFLYCLQSLHGYLYCVVLFSSFTRTSANREEN